jgi:hypothetical protein
MPTLLALYDVDDVDQDVTLARVGPGVGIVQGTGPGPRIFSRGRKSLD